MLKSLKVKLKQRELEREVKLFHKKVANSDRDTGVGVTFNENKNVLVMVVIDKKSPKSIGLVASLTERMGLELILDDDGDWAPRSVIPNLTAMIKLPVPEDFAENFRAQFDRTFPKEGYDLLNESLRLAQTDLASKIDADMKVKA